VRAGLKPPAQYMEAISTSSIHRLRAVLATSARESASADFHELRQVFSPPIQFQRKIQRCCKSAFGDVMPFAHGGLKGVNGGEIQGSLFVSSQSNNTLYALLGAVRNHKLFFKKEHHHHQKLSRLLLLWLFVLWRKYENPIRFLIVEQ